MTYEKRIEVVQATEEKPRGGDHITQSISYCKKDTIYLW